MFGHVNKKQYFCSTMRRQPPYRIWSIVILLAICHLSVVKGLHHHSSPTHIHSTVCVLDGADLSDNKAHHHPSVLPAVHDDKDHCVICQFQIVKLQKPVRFARLIVLPQYETLYLSSNLFLQEHLSSLLRGRAPPVC